MKGVTCMNRKNGNKINWSKSGKWFAYLFIWMVAMMILVPGARGQASYEDNDFRFIFTPLGLNNQSGPCYPAALGMGGVSFSQPGAIAGFYNPAILSLDEKIGVFLSGSFSHGFAHLYTEGELVESLSFSHNYFKPESASFSFKYKGWKVAAGYGYFHNLSRPQLSYTNYLSYTTESISSSQKGNIHDLLLTASYDVTSKFAVGFSIGYLFGEVTSDFYRNTEWIYGFLRDYQLKGIYYSFGCLFRAGEKWSLGLAFRPAIHYWSNATSTTTYLNPGNEYIEKLKMKFPEEPFMFLAGLSFLPVKNLRVAADISFWGWGGAANPVFPWFYDDDTRAETNQIRKNVIKINLGYEYSIQLVSRDQSEQGDLLKIRAGYIFDPGYLSDRHFITAGVGVEFKKFGLDVAALLPLSTCLPNRVYTTVFSLGIRYYF